MRRDTPATPDGRAAPRPTSKPRLWVTAALFFTQYVAFGVYFTFLNVYLRSVGLTGSEIGFNGMVVGIFAMLGTFAWSYVADRTGRPRVLLAVGALGTLAGAQLVPLVASNSLQVQFVANGFMQVDTVRLVEVRPGSTGNDDDFRVLAGSPTIDAGYELTNEVGLEPMPNGGRYNLGHTGNTPQATTSGQSPGNCAV